MLKQCAVTYFSPTGGTKKAALLLAQGLSEQIAENDLSLPGSAPVVYGPHDTVIFASPVFGGRLPAFALEKLKAYQGRQTKVITLVTYGNRDYDDALLELNDCLQSQGFVIVASAAVVAQHSILNSVAAGRPDAKDKQELLHFSAQILEKLTNGSTASVHVPGNVPYKTWTTTPAVPLVSAQCTQCGLCAASCPTLAISPADPHKTDAQKCILCMRCISICPQKARALPPPMQQAIGQMLAPLEKIRRESELFL